MTGRRGFLRTSCLRFSCFGSFLSVSVIAVRLFLPGLAGVAWAAAWPPLPAEDLKMTSVPDQPGAAAIMLLRDEVANDPLNYHQEYVRIKPASGLGYCTARGEDDDTELTCGPDARLKATKGTKTDDLELKFLSLGCRIKSTQRDAQASMRVRSLDASVIGQQR